MRWLPALCYFGHRRAVLYITESTPWFALNRFREPIPCPTVVGQALNQFTWSNRLAHGAVLSGVLNSSRFALRVWLLAEKYHAQCQRPGIPVKSFMSWAISASKS